MSKRIRLSVSPAEERKTDWSKCFLCQVDTSESLILPEKKKTQKGSGLTTLANNIPQFHMINKMPIPVMAADQPLYAIAKQIQWQWPEQYGEDKFIVMFGGLHIEMASLKLLGDKLKSSGWTEALAEAEVATSGTADSFLSASNVVKTRQAHLITASSLYGLMKDAFSNSEGQFEDKEQELYAFREWCNSRSSQIPQFQFWATVLNLEILVFCFIRAYRESDFQLYRGE